ncbi:MAG TPA: ribosome maturation factor RimM [Candidatus Kapabacteria bacterium]
MTDHPEELVLIARIGKPHGIRGEVSVQSFSFDDRRFKKLKRIFLRNAKGEISERMVKTVRLLPTGILFTFEGITDRNAAELLRNMEILIPESERPRLPKGRAYYDEIIGMAVIDDTTGAALGTVTNVLDMPGADIFVLDLNGTEHLLTNRGEEIKKLDVKKRKLRVTLLEVYGA